MSVWAAMLLVILSCLMLYLSQFWLTAPHRSPSIRVSDKVIGLTIVAIGTSLPELAASVAAALKRDGNINRKHNRFQYFQYIMCTWIIGLYQTY